MATQTYKRRHLNNLKRPQQEANMADKLSQTPTEEKLEPARITVHLHQLQPVKAPIVPLTAPIHAHCSRNPHVPNKPRQHAYTLARMPYATAIQSLRACEHTYHQLCGSRRNHHPPHLEYLVGTHCSTHILGRLLHVEHRLASKDIKTTYNNNNCWHTQCILVTIDINTKQPPSTTPQEP